MKFHPQTKPTEEEKDRIAELWRGGYSAGEISRHLKTRSRNAIIGLIDRARKNGDPRFVSNSPSLGGDWSDRDSLKLLMLHENCGLSFGVIAVRMKRSARSCEHQYRAIIRDLNASEAL